MRYLRCGWHLLNLLLATVILGTLALFVGLSDPRKKYSGFIARTWARYILWITRLPYTVHGLENLKPKQKYIFVGNHESALDIPIALATLPYNIVFMAKKELFRIPLFGWAMWAVGMIRVDRQNREQAKLSVQRALDKIARQEISVLVYPEGTRTYTGEMQRFKKGSFILAIQTGLPVVPITICGAFDVVPKKSLVLKQGMVELFIDPPLPTADLTLADRDQLMQNTREIILARKKSQQR